MHAHLPSPKRLLTLYQIIKNMISLLSQEIVHSHPDINIIVAALTVSIKSIDRPIFSLVKQGMIMSMKLRHLYIHCMGLENRMPKQAHSFLKAKHDLEMLPPTHGSLELHITRENYQAKIWL